MLEFIAEFKAKLEARGSPDYGILHPLPLQNYFSSALNLIFFKAEYMRERKCRLAAWMKKTKQNIKNKPQEQPGRKIANRNSKLNREKQSLIWAPCNTRTNKVNDLEENKSKPASLSTEQDNSWHSAGMVFRKQERTESEQKELPEKKEQKLKLKPKVWKTLTLYKNVGESVSWH